MAEYRANTRNDLPRVGKMLGLNCDQIIDMQAVSAVLPFRVNDYVVKNLIDHESLPADPIFQLTFPQREMLADEDFKDMRDLVSNRASESEICQAALKVQQKLNPHPAGQLELNKPKFGDDTLEGMQHKYNETVLFFPAQGQTCHVYCTYCFRWAQFIGDTDLKFASREASQLVEYVRDNPQISSVLITGGDPMVMKTKFLRRYVEPLLDIPHLDSIRVGTKALAYWPYRFTEGEDADDFLRLIGQVRAKDKHFALMAHSSHPRELEPAPAREAMRRVIGAGATVRCQAPLIKHVNDHQDIWADLWRKQVKLGAVPYYMFVERDTGPKNYFEVPLARAFNIFTRAYRQVSGLSRTARGPSMSATPGKVLIDGIAEISGERVFVLKFLQGRNPDWVNRVFFAKFDPQACWLDELEPAFGEDSFFFETEMEKIESKDRGGFTNTLQQGL
jgi:KamA family protein